MDAGARRRPRSRGEMADADRQPARAAARPRTGTAASGCAATRTLGYGEATGGAGRDRRPRRPARPARPGAPRARPWTTSTSRRWSAQLGRRRRRRRAPAAGAGARAAPAGLGDPRRRRADPVAEGAAPARRHRAAPGVRRPVRHAGAAQHDLRDAGAAGELTGASRRWEFGDEQPLDVVRTIGNAVRRRAGGGRRPLPVRLEPEDFEVVETERRASAAVALCVDLSYLDVRRGPLGPDEADRAGAVAPGRDPVPAGRAADHRLRPVRDDAVAGRAGRRSSRTWCRAPTCSTR